MSRRLRGPITCEFGLSVVVIEWWIRMDGYEKEWLVVLALVGGFSVWAACTSVLYRQMLRLNFVNKNKEVIRRV